MPKTTDNENSRDNVLRRMLKTPSRPHKGSKTKSDEGAEHDPAAELVEKNDPNRKGD